MWGAVYSLACAIFVKGTVQISGGVGCGGGGGQGPKVEYLVPIK